MRNKAFIWSACLALVFFLVNTAGFPQAYSGKGRMKGVVMDEQGNPIEGVKVKLYNAKSDSGFETKTDDNGIWEAIWIRGGTWDIDFSKAGYEIKKIFVEVNESGKVIPVETKMKKLQGFALPEELLAELDKGNALFDEGKLDEAQAIYEKLLQANPEAYVINFSIGNCYFKKEDYDRAIVYYLKVLDKDPNYVKALISMGNSYSNKKDVDRAMEYYNRIDIAKIDDVDILYNIGSNYYNNSKFEDALKYYKKAVEMKPDYADGLYQMGLTELNLGNFQEAVTSFENYLKIDPDSQRASQVKGFLDYLKKK